MIVWSCFLWARNWNMGLWVSGVSQPWPGQILSHVLCLVAQSCPICEPIGCSPPGSSVHGDLQARILEWVAMPSSRGSSQPSNRTQVSHIAGRLFTVWATREARSEVYSLVFFSITIIVTGVQISWHWHFQGVQAEGSHHLALCPDSYVAGDTALFGGFQIEPPQGNITLRWYRCRRRSHKKKQRVDGLF